MIKSHNCIHCRDEKWVLAYSLELSLRRQGFHMTDIPAEIFEKLPLKYLFHCHCQIGILLPYLNQDQTDCSECSGATWRFSEFAEEMGYRWQKVVDLAPTEVSSLSCEYFERCPCGYEENTPKSFERKRSSKEVFRFLQVTLPRFGFSV